MKTAHILLKNDLISCMASDAHRSYMRTPYMREAKEGLIRLGGYEFAWYLTEKDLDIYTPCRFDVVAIEGEEIRLYQDAFFYQG